MQGEVYPAYCYGIIGLQFFNTDRTEITPGSDVVAEDLDKQWLLCRRRHKHTCRDLMLPYYRDSRGLANASEVLSVKSKSGYYYRNSDYLSAITMTTTTDNWRPTATRTMLEQRAGLLARIREFMARRSILEVETPVLNPAANPDPNIASLATMVSLPFGAEPNRYYLHTSPEFAMKRLLAAGSGPIYQITRVFRDQEAGRIHQPEFTMLEWYRPGFDHQALMDEMTVLLTELRLTECMRLPYAMVFEDHTSLNPHTCSLQALQERAHMLGLQSPTADRSLLLDVIFSHAVAPNLGLAQPLFIYDYPVCQAALARIRQADIAVAERFELFIGGMEIANGYHELRDDTEQAQRFAQENAVRKQRGLTLMPVDDLLLAALRHGLPDCAGVALGLDRLLMTLTGSQELKDVLAFPVAQD